MRQLVAACILSALVAAPLQAQEENGDNMSEGLSLMEQGARMMMRGLMAELEPALRELEPALRELEPALRELARLIDDIDAYEAPEMLPNGDIIIRRKEPLTAEEEIDL